ncbi:MAG: hypothetical protein M1281_13590 [Chloroflexi bacterium]|nr:hypothetical protein [Chloroflexota bacterium]
MEIRIGKVTHYYNHLSVAVLDLSGEINTGDYVHILGRNTDFSQRVKSMEIEHHTVQKVGSGMEVALKVLQRVRKGDVVYKVPVPESRLIIPEEPSSVDTGL